LHLRHMKKAADDRCNKSGVAESLCHTFKYSVAMFTERWCQKCESDTACEHQSEDEPDTPARRFARHAVEHILPACDPGPQKSGPIFGRHLRRSSRLLATWSARRSSFEPGVFHDRGGFREQSQAQIERTHLLAQGGQRTREGEAGHDADR